MKRTGKRARPAGPPAASARGRAGGIGRGSSPAAEAISDDLRRGDDAFLGHRRRIAGLSLAGIGSLGVVAAYQFGIVRSLPEPPGRIFDAARVDASGEAYQYLKTPDATLGMLSTAVTLVLAGMGAGDRHRRRHWVPVALAAKVVADAVFSGYLTVEQVSKHRRLCFWCLLAAASSAAAVPAAIPEAVAAIRDARR
ncbi:MAG: vitamin K epoxide reductase family protein [Acidimicrobiales bacterium]